MFGSLNEFVDGVNENVNITQLNIQDQQPISPITKYSKKKMLQIHRKRTMSGIQTYKASDKTTLFQKFEKNFPQVEKANKMRKQNKKQSKMFTQRKPISQSRISSLFYGQNPLKMKDEIAKQQLKRDHNLLRAIVRTKMNEEEKVTNTDYEDSFARMIVGLKNIRVRPILQNEPVEMQLEEQTSRSLQVPIYKRPKSRLNNLTRLQFENCLNWSKKRKKDGSFYAQKLGKNKKIQVVDRSVENRKSILQFIHQRSQSVGLPN